jgi:hypothetical protein
LVIQDDLPAERLTPLPERLETALVNLNLNVAIPVVTQINTGVQVAALSSSPQAMVQGNLASAGLLQGNL